MKNSLLWLSIFISLTCGFLLFVRESELNKVRAQLASASETRPDDTTPEQPSLARPSAAILSQPSHTTIPSPQAQPWLPQKTNSVSEFLRREAVRELMRDEAKAGSARQIKALFKSGLAEYLGLDADRSAKLQDLLTKKSDLIWQDFLMPLFTGDLDETAMRSAGQQLRTALEQNASQTRDLLGDEGLAKYEAFEKTQPERDRVTEFGPAFSKAGRPLSPEQQAQLLDAMTEERLGYKFDQDFSNPLELDLEHWQANFTEEKFQHYRDQAEELNHKFSTRAELILSPEQLDLFNQLLARQLLRSEMTVHTTMALTSRK